MKSLYVFLSLFFTTLSCLPSEPLLVPLAAKFNWSCQKKNNVTNEALKADQTYANIKKLKEIVTAAIHTKNETIITVRSDNYSDLKLLRVQLTDPEQSTTFLITYSVHFPSNYATNQSERTTIWDFATTEAHKAIGTSAYTNAQISQVCVDSNPIFQERLRNILLCTTSDRLDFYPQNLTSAIPSYLNNNPLISSELLERLDNRIVEEIKKALEALEKKTINS